MSVLNELLAQTKHQEVKDWVTTMVRVIDDLDQGEIEHIIDYLNNRMEKGKKTRLRKMSYDDAVRLSKEWVEKQNKKAKDIVESDADVEEIVKLDNGLRLVKLVGENAYKREGKLMSHCVGSYADKGKNIYSIRDSKNSPHCTIEISKDKSRADQVKGKGNGSIHSKYIGSVLKALKHLDVEIRKSEMSYLGYREIKDDIFELYNDNFKDFKYINYAGSIFMYVNQKFNRK